MAIYKVWRTPLIPTRALEAGGAEAGPNATEEELKRDEKGKLEVYYKAVGSGHVAYTEPADYEALSDEDKANSTYSPFPSFFKEHERFEFESPDGQKFTSVEEVKTKQSRGKAKASNDNE